MDGEENAIFFIFIITKLMSRNTNIALLILRVSISGMMLLHGIAKLGNGFAGIKGMLASMGMPEFFAYGAFVGEVLAPLLLLVGFLSRPAAAVIAFNMLVAVAMAHGSHIFALDDMGGWAIELPMLYFFPALALVFTGGGKYSLSSRTFLD